ncbi:MAG TPA: phosphatase PAP2 family protein [Candidatus Saccharimonadales bacterium]|jgi:membrane-associated phospholipid phosphatase|nr:phosphatase PAP2 family protein [Candidatus Saccharimonadales bacterium]
MITLASHQLNRQNILRIIGAIGTLTCLILFVRDFSWPTPDKLLVFLTFVFMMFSQALAMLKRLGPVVAIIFVYESFRGLAPSLNSHVHYTMMIHADQTLFNVLPTAWLQNLLWHGHVMWYDFVFYGAYMLHFILPLGLMLLIWKFHDKQYWRVAGTYLVLSFAGFLTFLLYPAAPPWLASNGGYIPHITRVSSDVFNAMGVHDFPSLYNTLSPNPVAAVPSLHAAYATLLVIFLWRYFGRKWGLIAGIYPLLIWLGTVYMGEHYAVDELLGIIYAVAAYIGVYAFADKLWPRLQQRLPSLRRKSKTVAVDDPL